MSEWFEQKIQDITVVVKRGNIANEDVDCIVVPEFNNCASYGGVGGAINAAGMSAGMDIYDKEAQRKKLNLGEAMITESGKDGVKLAHIVTSGARQNEQLGVVNNAVFNTLMSVNGKGVRSIALPEVGTGIIGSLTQEQSAKAMFNAVYKFAQSNPDSDIKEISLVVYRGSTEPAEKILQDKSYINFSDKEKGEKEFDIGAFAAEMDTGLNKQFPKTGHNTFGNTLSRIERMRSELEEKRSRLDAVPHYWDIQKSYMKNIEDISAMSRREQKAIKTNFQKGYLIPAASNIIDTEFSIIDQQMHLKEDDKAKIMNLFSMVCKEQKHDVVGFDNEVLGVAICKEIFTRFPEEFDKVDLPQTLRMFNILKQSQKPENKDLLPNIEKSLQTKAWHYFSSERKYGADFAKMVRPTPYSVSCMAELKEYMTDKLHAPEDIIAPKLKDIEYAMMSDIHVDTLQKELSMKAKKLVFFTATDNPEHGSSSRIIENIDFTDSNKKGREI